MVVSKQPKDSAEIVEGVLVGLEKGLLRGALIEAKNFIYNYNIATLP